MKDWSNEALTRLDPYLSLRYFCSGCSKLGLKSSSFQPQRKIVPGKLDAWLHKHELLFIVAHRP
jgi:hypothetical protein